MNNSITSRRSRLQTNYTQTSNVLLFGYRGVSAAAKITYQAIDAFDWPDSRGARKGFAYPTIGKLGSLMGLSERTIQRHLEELASAGLITKQERPGRPSLLVIEDPSADQAEQYLTGAVADPEGDETDGRDDDHFSETPDISVTPPPTKMSPPIQEIRRKEKENNVEQALVDQRRGEGSSSTHISTTIQHRQMELRARRTTAADQRAEVIADELCAKLGDEKSRAYYRAIARTVPAHRIYEILGQVSETWRDGRITKTRGALFAHLMTKREEQLTANPSMIR